MRSKILKTPFPYSSSIPAIPPTTSAHEEKENGVGQFITHCPCYRSRGRALCMCLPTHPVVLLMGLFQMPLALLPGLPQAVAPGHGSVYDPHEWQYLGVVRVENTETENIQATVDSISLAFPLPWLYFLPVPDFLLLPLLSCPASSSRWCPCHHYCPTLLLSHHRSNAWAPPSPLPSYVALAEVYAGGMLIGKAGWARQAFSRFSTLCCWQEGRGALGTWAGDWGSPKA